MKAADQAFENWVGALWVLTQLESNGPASLVEVARAGVEAAEKRLEEVLETEAQSTLSTLQKVSKL